MSPNRRARNTGATEALSDQLTLSELRAMRQQTQKDVAAVMNVLQPAVAKLESRGRLSVSSLARFVEALGGTLVVTARFPEQSITLKLAGLDDGATPSIGGSEVR